MKGVEKSAIAIVAAVILILGLLALAWMSGILPIGKEYAKMMCWREMGTACSRYAGGKIDIVKLENIWEKCRKYYPEYTNYEEFCEEEHQVTLPLP